MSASEGSGVLQPRHDSHLIVVPATGGTEIRPPFADDTPTIQLSEPDARPPIIAASAEQADPVGGLLLQERYYLEDKVGEGGYSIVFRAKDLDRPPEPEGTYPPVAVKLLRAEQRGSSRARTRLRREFYQLRRLSHPGIVQVLDLDCDGDLCFMTMEFVDGQTVKQWMQTPRTLADVLQLLDSCGSALAHAHSIGIAHGDLKPTNIMVTADGEAKLIDFGSAFKAGDADGQRPDASVTATPLYASPQVLSGKNAEPRDDVFSLACLIYAILTGGRHPFGGRPSLEDGRAKSAPTYVHVIPHRLFDVIERALSADPQRRPATILDFVRACNAATCVEIPEDSPESHDVLALSDHKLEPLTDLHPLIADHATRVHRMAQRVSMTGGLVVLAVAIAGAAIGLLAGAPPPISPAVAAVASVPHAAVAPRPQAAQPLEEVVLTELPKPVPRAAGFVSFDAPDVIVSTAQSLVAITVKRSTSQGGSGSFVWRVNPGSAEPGVDYEEGSPQVARFQEGQSVRTIFIPLLKTKTPPSLNFPRFFTVVLRQTPDGPALGRITRVRVTIDPIPGWSSAVARVDR